MALAWLLVALCGFVAVPPQAAAAAAASSHDVSLYTLAQLSSVAVDVESVDGRSLLQADCGDKGQPCCPGDDNSDWCGASGFTIFGNRRCSDDSGIGTCLGCGGVGEVCCQRRPSEEPECARGAVCTGSRCEPCGGFGELCCASTSRPCISPSRGGCSDGRCATAAGPCGALGQPCCRDRLNRASCSRQSLSGVGLTLLCSEDDTCIACGRTGEPCCEEEARSAGRGFCDNANICAVTGQCVPCGERGEPCCQRSFGGTQFCSADGLVCDANSGCCGTTSCDDVAFGFRPGGPPPAPPSTPLPVASAPPPQGVAITLPDPADGSAGAAAIGIALDASEVLTEAEFNVTRDQVVAFIDRSSDVNAAGVANANVYYIITFTSALRDFTGISFITNTNREVSRRVQRFVWRGGIRGEERSFPAAALNALADGFESLSRTASASAVVITASTVTSADNTAETVAAAQRLRTSVTSLVTISAIALTTRTNVALLERVAARSVTGQLLVFRTSVFTRVESLLITSTSTAGGIAIVIALDTSSAVSEEEFLTARAQLISFIDSSSGVNTAAGVNRNIYYVNAFSTAVRISTRVFLSNADRQVSRLIEQFFIYRGGSIDVGINLAVGIDDLTAQISRITVSTPVCALVVAAGSSSRTAAVAAAGRLRSSYGGGVSIGCVPLGSASSANVATLTAIASTGLDGATLSRRAPAVSSIAAQCVAVLRSLDADGDGAADTADACPADAAKVEAGRCGCGTAETPDCGDVTRCQGDLNIGITLDSSGSIGTADFEAAKEQIITFVDVTSGASTTAGANSIRYYVNAFSSSIVGSTGSFLTNSNRRVSRSIQSNIEFTAGGTDIAAGIEDLTAQFRELTGPVAGLAVVITDGRSSRAAAEAAADELRSVGVTVAAVAIGDGVDRPTLEAVASTGSDGEVLVFETDSFEDIAGLLATVFTRIDQDGDGVDDCRDGCPSDPAKTAPGRCGCGRAEQVMCANAPAPISRQAVGFVV